MLAGPSCVPPTPLPLGWRREQRAMRRGSADDRLPVLGLGDVLEPRHHLSLVVGLLEGEVGHEAVWCRAVPVLFAGLDVDDVAGTDLLYVAPSAGDKTDPVGDVQGLTFRVGVPGRVRARGEPDVSAADRRPVVRDPDAVDVHGPGELGLRADGRLSAT